MFITFITNTNKKAVLSQRWPHNAPYIWVPLMSLLRVGLYSRAQHGLLCKIFSLSKISACSPGSRWMTFGLIVRAIKISKISNLCDPDPLTLETDRQTDRHTDDVIARPRFALCYIARYKLGYSTIRSRPTIQYNTRNSSIQHKHKHKPVRTLSCLVLIVWWWWWWWTNVL